MPALNRREFMAAAAAGVAAATGATAQPAPKAPPVCIFSKHLQFMPYERLAEATRELGLDGVDLTVRKGGHVEPDKVETDFPRAVEAVRKAGSEVYMISTTLYSGDDPEARPIMSMVQKLGVRYVRIGGQKYDRSKNPAEQLPKFTEELRSLTALAEEYGLTMGYHNHSGYGNVGGPVWDLYQMIRDVNSPHFGSNFDGAHATVEGAFGVWQTNARLMAPHVKMMAVKDFVWNRNRPEWVALGKGIVQTAEIFKIMRETGFSGPVSLHFEYELDGKQALLDEIRETAVTCRAELAKAGYG